MSVLVRTGGGIADVIWKNKLAAGDKVFLRTHQWITTVAGGSYDCLHRTGSGITDVAYSVENIPLPYDPDFKPIYDAVVSGKIINIQVIAAQRGTPSYRYYLKTTLTPNLYTNSIYFNNNSSSKDKFGSNREYPFTNIILTSADQSVIDAMNKFNNVSLDNEYIGKYSAVSSGGNPRGALWSGQHGITTTWCTNKPVPSSLTIRFHK